MRSKEIMRNRDIKAELIFRRDRAEEDAAMDWELNDGLTADYYEGQADAFDQMRVWLDGRKDPVGWVLDCLEDYSVKLLKLTDLYEASKDKDMLDRTTHEWVGVRDVLKYVKDRLKKMEKEGIPCYAE